MGGRVAPLAPARCQARGARRNARNGSARAFAQPAIRFSRPVLEVGAPARVAGVARQLLGGASKDYAFLVRTTPLLNSERTVASLRWPSVDVLHLHATASRDARRRPKQSEPGGLGWLFRLADRWQVRLIVIEALPADAGALRQTAQRLVDRGGSAVFVLASSMANTLELYSSLLHDRPLDWCQQKLSNCAFFGGSGRSEAVRFSSIGLELSSLKGTQRVAEVDRGGQEQPPRPESTQVPLNIAMWSPRSFEKLDRTSA